MCPASVGSTSAVNTRVAGAGGADSAVMTCRDIVQTVPAYAALCSATKVQGTSECGSFEEQFM
jgi:hypothetical protein